MNNTYVFWAEGTPCPWPVHSDFDRLANAISYHHADDSGQERGLAERRMEELVDLVIRHRCPFWAIREMASRGRYLMSFDGIIQSLLRRLYDTQSEKVS